MKVSLSNSHITAIIDTHGAELQSLQTQDGLEYMWQANPQFWAKHSPVLFPIVGTLVQNSFTFNGRQYQLPRHGFARDKEFTCTANSASSATFELTSSNDTWEVYPFSFRLSITYLLVDNSLTVAYLVGNTGVEPMYFSLGAHPAFNLPLQPSYHYTDYCLSFPQDPALLRYKLSNGLLSGQTQVVPTKPQEPSGSELSLHPALFYDDALVLKKPQSTTIELKPKTGGRGLSFDFKGFEYLGIWGAKDAPFVCLEPWCGVADNENHNGNITEKEGIQHLESGQEWSREWKVTLF